LQHAELSESACHCAFFEAALNRQGLALFLSVLVSFCYPGIAVDTMVWTLIDPVYVKHQQQQQISQNKVSGALS